MKSKFPAFRKYLLNCFWLMIPVLIWDVFFSDHLPRAFQPDVFQYSIPLFILVGEHGLRILIFLLTLLMPLPHNGQRSAVVLYVAGVLIYFASWLPLIVYPESRWSQSFVGFMAPAYTPVCWLTGIAMIGYKFYVGWPYKKWMFIMLSVIFLVFHNVHTWLVYSRLY